MNRLFSHQIIKTLTIPRSIACLWLGTVGVTFAAKAQEAPRLEWANDTPESISLRVLGQPTRAYRIDASSDLALWSFLVSSNGSAGIIEFSDRKAQAPEHRFYRAAETSEVLGQVRPLGRGTVRSWVRIASDGRPSAIGLTLSEAALTNLPSSGMELVLALPTNSTVAPFNHIGLNWNPQGHPPAGVYNRAHFDVHFYTVTVQERNTISSNDGGAKMYQAPDPAFLPLDYDLSPGSGDARMGSHWWDLTAPEVNGQSFTHTLIYGYYDGNLTFIEPMVTISFLKGKPALLADIKQPVSFAKAGIYPLQYRISHSEAFREYSVSLEGLTTRQASLAAPVAPSNSRRSGLRPPARDTWCRASGGLRLLPD